MKIFIDLDDTLFNTSCVLEGRLIGHLILAEENAPLFEGAKEALKKFNQNGHECFALTGRGNFSEEEVIITKRRLRELGICSRDPSSLLVGMIDSISNRANGKYEGIKHAYNNYYQTDVQANDTVLIDDNIGQVAFAAANGIKCVWLTDNGNITKEARRVIDKLKISIAHSWDEIADIVLNRKVEQG